eukprot:CAMPEP_0181172424 /NCGR_PEP_ID=MMETSP1096-20121128/2442_1 /TAXON_ID=156174 ORGANISM="Chrysochromulina ericina, Strain CCMP281" /NCGR_SAMPLE_ID=MMETSP1096 /ASSEMBLY_ACC=CAM_ASM_000453 /LENGTH=238 /DNA_ID=CAMNT_0023260151 /DNA_START=338 /DNA_END=1055 /DNA_ORIENTATION=+
MLFGVGSQGCYHTDHTWAPLEESRNVTARVRRFLSHALEESPRHQQVVVQVHSGLWDVFATKANSLCSTPMPAGMKSFMGPFYNGEWAINVRERLISPVREIISERRPDAKLIWRSMPFLCDHAAFGNDAKLTHFMALASTQGVLVACIEHLPVWDWRRISCETMTKGMMTDQIHFAMAYYTHFVDALFRGELVDPCTARQPDCEAVICNDDKLQPSPPLNPLFISQRTRLPDASRNP